MNQSEINKKLGGEIARASETALGALHMEVVRLQASNAVLSSMFDEQQKEIDGLKAENEKLKQGKEKK